jgi:hypothetical protein
MAESPVAAVTINLPSDGESAGPVTMPDIRPLLSGMATTLESIATGVNGLLVTTRTIAELLARMGGRNAVVPAVASARRRGDLTNDLDRLFRNPPPPVPTRAPPRPVPVPVGVRASGPPRTMADRFGPMLSMPPMPGVAGMRIPLGLGAAGAVIGPALVGYGLIRLANSMGDASMQRLSRFSPQVAGLQSQVEVNRWMKSYEIANSPMVVTAAKMRSSVAMQFDQAMGPVRMAGEMAALGLASVAGAGFMTSPFGYAMWLLGSRMTSGPAMGANGVAMNELNTMVGDLLRMQERPIRTGGRDRPTRVRWGPNGWERGIIR